MYPFADGVGHKRDGYCRVTSDDSGNHSIAATVTQPFLDFTQSKGNNLTQAGVKDGMKWCLCAHRWKEAYDAFRDGQLSRDAVPKVHVASSDAEALKVVGYGDLSKFKDEGAEVSSHRSRNQGHIDPSSGRGAVRETGELSKSFPGNDQGGRVNKKTEIGGGTGTG